jgi:hypothetical protein
VISKQLDEALPDHASGAENAGAKSLCKVRMLEL